MKKFIFREFGPLAVLIIAILLTPLLIVGILYNIGKSIYHASKLKGWTAIKHFFKYWGLVLYQFWAVIRNTMYYGAFIIDLLGNVFTGELIEDLVTPEEKTYYGKGDLTISFATGEIEHRAKVNPKKLTKIGLWFIRVLNKFEDDHCSKAYRLWVFKKKLKEEKSK